LALCLSPAQPPCPESKEKEKQPLGMRCCAMLWVRKEMQNGGEERKGDRHHDIGLGLDVSGGGGEWVGML